MYQFEIIEQGEQLVAKRGVNTLGPDDLEKVLRGSGITRIHSPDNYYTWDLAIFLQHMKQPKTRGSRTLRPGTYYMDGEGPQLGKRVINSEEHQ